MKTNRLPLLALLLIVALATFGGSAPAWAQEDEDVEEDDGRAITLLVEIEGWDAQPAGLDFNPATVVDPNNPYNATLQTFTYDTSLAARYRAGVQLNNNLGAVVLTWFAQRQEMNIGASTPGAFQFGQVMTHPVFAGFANDGLADGYSANAAVVLRDFRIDYYRTAFKSSKITGKWFVGWRRVQHKRDMTTYYAALSAPLPPLIPPFVPAPRDDLTPGTDTATTSSHWEGRGINAGMDFIMPLWKDKFSLIGGFDIAMLRGKTDVSYNSTTYFYVIDDAFYLSPPYDAISDPDLVGQVTQESLEVGLQANSRSTTSGILEGYFGARWDATRWMAVQLGFRSAYYNNVGVELRPKSTSFEGGANLQDITETDYSVTYEGFYLGVGFAF